MNVIQAALADLDRKAGADRAGDAMRVALNVIAASNLSAVQRTALICELELSWQAAGLT